MKKKIKNTYQREIERKPLNNLIVSSSLAFLIILSTIIFGIRPITLTLIKNKKYSSELENLKSNMETKINQTEKGRRDIEKYQKEISLLHQKIPVISDFQEFLKEIVLVASKYEFIIKQVKNRENNKLSNEIVVVTVVEGPIKNLPELLNDLENNMSRFIKIDSIKTQKEEDLNFELVEINMKIYTLK